MDEKLKGYQSTLIFQYKSNAKCSPKFVKKLPFTVCCYTASFDEHMVQKLNYKVTESRPTHLLPRW